jgi:RNA recognition motif-containing protein
MNIYVGNIPLGMTEEELRREFTPFGEVISVTIMDDQYIGSGQARGYGYVKMASRTEGAAAIAELSGKVLKDRPINCIEALPLSSQSRSPSRDAKTNNRSNRSRERGYTHSSSGQTSQAARNR